MRSIFRGFRYIVSYSPQDFARKFLVDDFLRNDRLYTMVGLPLKLHSQHSYHGIVSDDLSASEDMYCAESLLTFNFFHDAPDFVDSCNGLILCVRRFVPQLYVCNPAVRQSVPIPIHPPMITRDFLFASLVFDPSESIHYRIVIPTLASQPQCLHVFYSNTGQWMAHEIQVKLPEFKVPFKQCVYLKGMLYRLLFSNNLLCFDLEAKKTHIYDCPFNVPTLHQGFFGVLDGSLSCALHRNGFMWLWLFDQSRSAHWILKHKSSMSLISKKIDPLSSDLFLFPLAFHPKSNIVFIIGYRSLFMYHLGTGHIEKVWSSEIGDRDACFVISSFTYARTLITLKDWCKISKDLDVLRFWSIH